MSFSRILIRLGIILVCALLGASVGTALQALRITSKPQEFRSIAKLVAGGQMASNDNINWCEQQADFYGTIIETLESAEIKHRALERVKALHPDLKDSDVEIRAVQTKGSGIINILATGPEPKYTKIFLDALLHEFINLRQNIRERAWGKMFQQFLQEVVTRQQKMEESMTALEKMRTPVESLSAKSDRERLVMRLNTLRNQRDDLRLELKPMAAQDAARSPLEAKLGPIELEIQGIEAELQRYESASSELRVLTEKHATAKHAYEKLFEKVEQIQVVFNSSAEYVAIQERASPASENVEDWKLPIALGAGGGGLLGGFIGLVLSLLIVRAPKPLPTTA